MKNKEKMMIFGILVLIMIININLTIAQENNETFVIAGREFTNYGNVTVESSVLKALTVEDKTIDIGIWINTENDTLNEIIKTQIIKDLDEEFELTWSSRQKNAFSGYLTSKGLEKLKNSSYPIT